MMYTWLPAMKGPAHINYSKDAERMPEERVGAD
jgi:hypothetical protein